MPDLPKIVMQRLHAREAEGIHPDLNVISAFVENSLPREARARTLQHLANCSDCREVVFLSSPDQAATLPAVVSSPASWLTWPVLRWGTAVAAVVVVATAVGLHRQMGKASTQSGAGQIMDAPVTRSSTTPPDENQGRAMIAPNAVVASSAAKKATASGASKELAVHSERADASPAAQSAEPYERKAGSENRDGVNKNVADEVAGNPVASATAPFVPGRAKGATAALSSNMKAGGANGPAIFMPMTSARWALTADGKLQRSVDLGNSWRIVSVAGQTSFRALAANGRDIWVGGSKGALYHSTDAGRNWTQVQPAAAGEMLTDDIVSLEFLDLLHGKLTTAGKEIWITEDGGQNWHKP